MFSECFNTSIVLINPNVIRESTVPSKRSFPPVNPGQIVIICRVVVQNVKITVEVPRPHPPGDVIVKRQLQNGTHYVTLSKSRGG